MDNTGADHLRMYDQRITRLEEEIADLQADKSEVYKEAKDHGFDLKAFRAARRDLKVEAKRDNTEADVYDLYREALRPNYPSEHDDRDEDEDDRPVEDTIPKIGDSRARANGQGLNGGSGQESQPEREPVPASGAG